MSLSLHARFTTGDCHILARAIHEATGWRIATFAYKSGQPTVHAFAQMPNGNFIDIDGISTHDEMMHRWFPTASERRRIHIRTYANTAEFHHAYPEWCDEIIWPASPAVAVKTAFNLLWKHCNADT